jgi:hypothetical protein
MARAKKIPAGAIAWRDLTVKNAKKLRDFYARVGGLRALPAATLMRTDVQNSRV